MYAADLTLDIDKIFTDLDKVDKVDNKDKKNS